ncbi:MAG: hypothetical protein WAV90_02495 [Gordonia amarae]
MAVDYPDRDRRRQLCETPVTLDDAPARIRGAGLPFARVIRSDGRGGDVEFSWPTAALIVAEKGGRFAS